MIHAANHVLHRRDKALLAMALAGVSGLNLRWIECLIGVHGHLFSPRRVPREGEDLNCELRLVLSLRRSVHAACSF